MQNLTILEPSVRFSCLFVEELIEEGPLSLQDWFKLSGSDPKGRSDGPSDFNSWSQVAKRIASAALRAVEAGNEVHALAYADIACKIYEEILPMMEDELAALGSCNIGFNITQVEAINIRIHIINRFGPQEPPSTLSLLAIEKWFFSMVEEKCNSDVDNFPLDLEDVLGSSREFKARCLDAQLKIINRLHKKFVSPTLRRCIDSCGVAI